MSEFHYQVVTRDERQKMMANRMRELESQLFVVRMQIEELNAVLSLSTPNDDYVQLFNNSKQAQTDLEVRLEALRKFAQLHMSDE